jgi:RHS repeat-associated protein
LYFLQDGHGSNRQLVQKDGTVSYHYGYDAYGVEQPEISSGGIPQTAKLYCGEQYDSSLGMYNLRSRYYNPSSGTFNQRDTFAGNDFDPQSLHKYTYCHGDPINGIDPSGQFTLGELVFVVAVISIIAGLTLPALMNANKNADRTVFHASGANALEYALARDPNSVKLDGVISDGQRTANDMALYYGELDRQIDLVSGNNTILAVNSIESIYTANDIISAGLGGGARVTRMLDIAAETMATARVLPADVKVIGRWPDTKAALEWPGHEVLNLPGANEAPHSPVWWDMEVNERWVADGIAKGQVFYCASPEEGNMISTSARRAGQPTVFAQEIAQLKAAGYVKVGDYYVPASKAATFKP